MTDNLISTIGNNIENKIYDENNIIYVNTNENLKEVFNNFDVKDKKVLTVLSSSDQLLSCLYNGAKEVDTFDRSYVTNYYFYLRKWLIEYKNQLYPSNKYLYDSAYELYKLIFEIKAKTIEERKARIFWLVYFETNNYKCNKYLFESRYCKGNTPFEDNIDKVREILPKTINFYGMDIFDEIDLDKTYDIIILSNMLEYETNNERRNTLRKNLEKLLNNNGIVICSYKTTTKVSNFHLEERDILTKNQLVLDKEFKYYEPFIGKEKELAYSYKKIS